MVQEKQRLLHRPIESQIQPRPPMPRASTTGRRTRASRQVQRDPVLVDAEPSTAPVSAPESQYLLTGAQVESIRTCIFERAKNEFKYKRQLDMCKSDLKAVTKLARERGVRYEEIVRRMGEIKRADLGSIVPLRAEGGGDAVSGGLCVFSQEFCDEVDREYARFKQELCEEHGLTWDQGNE